MYNKQNKENSNKSKDKNNFKKINNKKYLKKLSPEELLSLKGNIENVLYEINMPKNIQKLNLDNEYMIVKVLDYSNPYRRDTYTLIINDNNIVTGYNEYYKRLVIGRIDKNNKIYLVGYEMDNVFIEIFDGHIELENGHIRGCWYDSVSVNSYIKKMSLFDKSFKLDDFKMLEITEETYEDVKKNIWILESNIINSEYLQRDKDVILEILKMNK